MQQFDFVFHDEAGLHARPAARLMQLAKQLPCTVTLQKGEKTADMKNLVKMMGLAICQNDTVRITVEGEGEVDAVAQIRSILEQVNA